MAEIGNNHEGDVGVARELVEQAAAAGAHAVKLQVFDPQLLRRPVAAGAHRPAPALRARPRGRARVARSRPRARARLRVYRVRPRQRGPRRAAGGRDQDRLGRQRPRHAARARRGQRQARDRLHRHEHARRHRARRRDARGGSEVALLHCVSAYPVAPERAALSTIGAAARALPDHGRLLRPHARPRRVPRRRGARRPHPREALHAAPGLLGVPRPPALGRAARARGAGPARRGRRGA